MLLGRLRAARTGKSALRNGHRCIPRLSRQTVLQRLTRSTGVVSVLKRSFSAACALLSPIARNGNASQ